MNNGRPQGPIIKGILMAETEPAGGDVVVYTRVRDPEARVRLRMLLDDLPGVRVNGSVYEVFTADWDEGSWDETVEQMQEIVNPTTDTLVFWRVVEGKMMRTSIAGRFA